MMMARLQNLLSIVDGNQTKVPTTGDTGQNPAVYHMNMTNLSYDAIHQNYSSMEVMVLYRTNKIKDGYSDLKISYHTRSDNKDHNDWQVHTEDLNKNNGKMRICDYYLNIAVFQSCEVSINENVSPARKAPG